MEHREPLGPLSEAVTGVGSQLLPRASPCILWTLYVAVEPPALFLPDRLKALILLHPELLGVYLSLQCFQEQINW